MVRKKKPLPPSSFVVTQSNELIEARYNLPLGEQRLVLTMISRIQPDDEDFKPYRISVSEFAEFLGIPKGSAYHECRKITANLLTRVINIREEGRLLQIGWMSSAEYIDGSGFVNLSFDPQLKPYLLQLKSNFTSCKLAMVLSFKSQYTMRIYTLLKQYEKLKEREIELDELREILGIRKEQYKLYTNFKKDVLVFTQQELSEKADLSFEFDEIKYGRKVGAIRFIIFSKPLPKTLAKCEQEAALEPVNNTPSTFTYLNAHKAHKIDDLLKLIPNQHQTKKTVLSALIGAEKKHGVDYVKRNILYANAKAGTSYAGFLANALKEDWGHDWMIDQLQPTQTELIPQPIQEKYYNGISESEINKKAKPGESYAQAAVRIKVEKEQQAKQAISGLRSALG